MNRLREQIEMRYVIGVLLLASVSLLAACTRLKEFAIVNESNQPIEVQYKIRKLPIEPYIPTGTPAKAATSQLGEREWRKLSDTEYRFDSETGTVLVRVMPGEALLIGHVRIEGDDESLEAADFDIEEITIAGANGEIRLSGKQTRTSFIAESNRLATLRYK